MDKGIIEKLKKIYKNKSYIAYCYQRETTKAWLIFQRNLISRIVATLVDAWSMSDANLKNMLQNLWGAAAEMVVHEQDLNDDMGEIVTMFQDIPGFSQHGQDDAEAWLNKDAADPGYQILIVEEIVTSVQVEECAAINQGDSDDQEEEEVESGKFKIILKNKLFQVYITCFYHVITSSCFLCLHKCVYLLLKLCKIIR